MMDEKRRDAATERVREFYDGPADVVYKTTWGENLHLGVPTGKGGTYQDAIKNTTVVMGSKSEISAASRVLDLGSGYGGPARYLASTFGCNVVGLNVSQVEIDEATRQTAEQGLSQKVTFDRGDFHDLPYGDATFDVVWSQDSLMYGADKNRILDEVHRVLKPGGVFDFTDILANRGLRDDERERLYARVRTPEMWDRRRYLNALSARDFMVLHNEDWSHHVSTAYAWARERALAERDALEASVGAELVQATLDGLAFWVDMASRGNVGWTFIVARKA